VIEDRDRANDSTDRIDAITRDQRLTLAQLSSKRSTPRLKQSTTQTDGFIWTASR
jgi:hypothetical protein